MDIKLVFEDILSSDNFRYSSLTIENLVMLMMENYITQQGKPFTTRPLKTRDSYFSPAYEYDGYAPDGFDNFVGSTAIELKIVRSGKFAKNRFQDTVKRIASQGNNINNLIFIVIANDMKIPEQMANDIQSNVDFNVYLWGVDDLARIFESNKDLFEEADFNLDAFLLKNTISKSIGGDVSTYLEKRNKYIEQLSNEYEADNLVLFLGAGASRGAKIATWDRLISELFVALIDKELLNNGINIPEEDKKRIISEIITQNGNSPLLQTRFLRNGLDKEFQEVISEILYKNSDLTSNLLEEIGQLCIPNRGKTGIQAIVNYNFDDLIEINLDRLRVKYCSIYGEGMVPGNDEMGIYHVHGFLPRNKNKYDNLSKSLLVFSEEGYHKLLLEPYHWANISQLYYFVNNTCLFIGLSMTDPNLRRLLEVAAQKNPDGDSICKHYAILPRLHIKSGESIQGIKSFEKANEALQESFYKELGINVLWIDNYAEIPAILKQIKC